MALFSGKTSTSPFNTSGTTIRKSTGSTIFGSSSGSFTPTRLPTTTQSFQEFSSLFPRPEPIKPPTIAPPPSITAPTIRPAVVATPENLQQRVSTIFAPQYAELARREQETLSALNADLAARGLAESGVGVGQTQRVRDEFDRNRTALLGEEAGQLLNVEAAVLFQNAANRQQTNMANAQLSFETQRVNAANILQGNLANAQLYMAALGLNAEVAQNFRNSFLSYFDAQQLRLIQQDELRLRFLEASFDAYLKNKALNADIAKVNAEAGGSGAQFTLPSAFAVGTPGIPTSGGTVPNVTPQQFRLAAGVEQSSRPGGGTASGAPALSSLDAARLGIFNIGPSATRESLFTDVGRMSQPSNLIFGRPRLAEAV